MTFSQFALPVKTLNAYTWSIMKQVEPSLQTQYGNIVPFFPLSDSASGSSSWEDKPYIVYDRIMRATERPFYPIKKEHIIYSLKGKEEDVFEWGSAIQYILDRQDDSAQDINAWNRAQANPAKVYFHSTRAFMPGSGSSSTGGTQAREFSNRPFYTAQFIILAEYHLTESIESFIT